MNKLKRIDYFILAALVLVAAIILASALYGSGRSGADETGNVVSGSGTSLTVEDDNTSEGCLAAAFTASKESFAKSFIREDRYQLILSGIGTTCLITFFSVLLGSVLAFLICLFRRSESVLADKLSDLYVKLMQGTPIVILMMILCYVILGRTGMPALWVAVTGFSLHFAAYASEILRAGIDSLHPGQREAALALGFSEKQAFFRFLFPQAVVKQMPAYRDQVITLLRSTSVVGYIAVLDMAKVTDMIRIRSDEAFFPLLLITVLYFLLAYLISVILNFVLTFINPKSNRNRTKGGFRA